MPTIPLPQKIEQLSYEIQTLNQSIKCLEEPVATPPTAAAGSLMETMAKTLTAIGDSEEQERSRLTKLAALRDLLSDAQATLIELERQQARSKPLFDAGLLRVEKSRNKLNKSIDAVLENWGEFEAALKSIENDALTQVGTIPYTRAQYPLESRWLTQLGKIGPLDAQSCFPVVRSYEFDRTYPDGE